MVIVSYLADVLDGLDREENCELVPAASTEQKHDLENGMRIFERTPLRAALVGSSQSWRMDSYCSERIKWINMSHSPHVSMRDISISSAWSRGFGLWTASRIKNRTRFS